MYYVDETEVLNAMLKDEEKQLGVVVPKSFHSWVRKTAASLEMSMQEYLRRVLLADYKKQTGKDFQQ
jgi:hypothetical protein